MWLLLLEALLALMILVFIVWWTMFSGRPTEGLQNDQTSKAVRCDGKNEEKETEKTDNK